ncbi:peptide methionine sulfoxide reductase [Oryzomicrobium terrae]|uniref:Peptide methionine sulfoxide reductase MsrA n=1 Tax=Oryzomicrobium terrae TaxID=1735038 RepID=A0A5C1E5D1_9RHOO|nr:peptide-methionine (S)-S-oxide reductase MsrA [Oryzomicrobium terrae]QEL64122.1 peptide methionine sulfoxide reductase [Oryzomicrobium terrae]
MDTPSPAASSSAPRQEPAILGGGCFWCLEAVFQELAAVSAVTSGYCGGSVAAPSYEAVCGDGTGHAEVVKIVFDPAALPFATLLDVFFAIHDPTTLNRQGNDVGTQYRSVIFCQSEAQHDAALAAVARAEAHWGRPVVTEIVAPVPAQPFWPAEDYHRDYFRLHGHQPYCAFVVAPKVAKARQAFAHLLAR